ncbi:MAG TPA: DUF1330 domain-containing protein [Pseudonocardia sp.]
MAHYFLAAIRRHDTQAYQAYQAAGRAQLIEHHRFEPLAVSPPFELEEGELDASDLILLRFPDKTEFESWWRSARYQEIKPLRLNSSDTLFAVTFEGA